jgi:outer membrane protein OmpA-like peptidoglycan-associated protein
LRWGAIVSAVLLGGSALWGISAITRSRAPRTGVTALQPIAPSPGPSAANPARDRPPAGVALPDGRILPVDRYGPEADFVRYLGDRSAALPHAFSFDRLKFATDRAVLTPGSTGAMDDLTAVLRSFPSAHVRIEGYPDGAGSRADNRGLSEERASMIKRELQARGVAADHMEAVGRSEAPPPMATQPGPSRPRQVDVVLLSR